MRSPIDDLTFDVITVLQNKAKALEAYDKYLRDAEDDDELHGIFTRIRDEDATHVRVLKEALLRRFGQDTPDEDPHGVEAGSADEDVEGYDEDYDEGDRDEIEDRGDDAVAEASTARAPRRGESTRRH